MLDRVDPRFTPRVDIELHVQLCDQGSRTKHPWFLCFEARNDASLEG